MIEVDHAVAVAESAWRLNHDLVPPIGTVLQVEGQDFTIEVVKIRCDFFGNCVVVVRDICEEGDSTMWCAYIDEMLRSSEIVSIPAGCEDFTQWGEWGGNECT